MKPRPCRADRVSAASQAPLIRFEELLGCFRSGPATPGTEFSLQTGGWLAERPLPLLIVTGLDGTMRILLPDGRMTATPLTGVFQPPENHIRFRAAKGKPQRSSIPIPQE